MRNPFRRKRAAGREVGPGEVKQVGLQGGFVALQAEASARWSQRSYAGLAREGYMRNPVAHRCVRLVAEAVSSVPFLLYEGGRDLDRHPMLDLLARPNGRMTGTGLVEAICGHLLLSGNAFVEAVAVAGRPRELHVLRPDRMRVVEGPDGWPVAFDYTVGDRRRRLALEPENGGGLLHLRLFDPLDDHLGFAPLAAAHDALDLSNAAAAWNKALLGIPGDNTYANYAEANRAFYRLTVLPLLTRLTGALGGFLAPAFGAGLRLTYDADAIAGLSAEREALWSRVGAADFLTEDEKREAVGYPPLRAAG
ncbi:phage portal protein [Pararhizobium mangrovi]|uniref:Phage portal protein n=1 Tax=Pararhizobium mangrovi TaxID=2590452 RepID=A0A506UHG2_9HYPH|nr:phage portal protein [Pararhizobium mangrovi]TPW32754.1 phage portal protein [Pararhizobium mangrovi]